MFDNHVKSDCVRKLMRISRLKFLDVIVANRETIHQIENKRRETGSLLDRKGTESSKYKMFREVQKYVRNNAENFQYPL